MLNTSCQAPHPSITRSPILKEDVPTGLNPDVTNASEEDILESKDFMEGLISNPEVKTLGNPLERQAPPQLGSEESITVVGEEQKSVFLKEIFLLDYQVIKSIHPNDPYKRLELSFFREALVNIMETEFYLALISGHTSFERISSEIIHPNLYRKGVEYLSPYRGVIRYHNYLQQVLNQSSSDTRQIMTAILIATAIEFSLIEQREKTIKEEISEAEDDETLQFLSQQIKQIMQDKNQIFAKQPWTMILFEQVLDHRKNPSPLKDLIMTIYTNHSSLINSQLHDNSIEIRSAEDHIYTEIQPLLTQAATQLLKKIPHRVNRYRGDIKALFVHDVIQQQTLNHLKDVQDNNALTAYDEWINQSNIHLSSNIAIDAGKLLICRTGALVAIPIAALFSILDILNKMSFKQALLKGATFGLNSYLQYDLYNNPGLSEFLLSVGAAALMCSTKSPPLSINHLSKTIRSFSNTKLSTQQILAEVKEKIFDIKALPAAMASLVALYTIERFQRCDEMWDIRECHEMWDQEFVLLFTTTFISEFVFVFKSLGKWNFFSMEHIKVMQSTARIVFGISLSTQVILNIINNKDFNDINYRLAFFEVTFSSLISLTTTRVALLYMVDPFSNWLEKKASLIGEKTVNFSLMFLKNILGNGLYLLGGHHFIDSEEEEKKDKDE